MRFSKTNLTVNLILAAIKASVGFFAGSRALVAAALYSINDVLSAFIVLVSLKVGAQPPDKDHAYGHGKAEFVAVAILSFVLAAGVFFLLYFSLIDIVRGVTAPPHFIALGVAVISLIANGLLAKRGFCAARTNHSPALHTSAEHNKADAYSSAAVLIGVGGAMLGLHVLDQIVAVFEAFHVLWLGGVLFGTSLKGLMDTALPDDEVKELAGVARKVEGVVDVLDLKTRRAGSSVWIDVIISVPDELSVEQATAVCNEVGANLMERREDFTTAQVGFRAISSQPVLPSPSGEEVAYAE